MPETIEQIMARVGQQPRNYEMPGNHRYQPKALIPYFGHDNLVRFPLEVEWALWRAQAKIGVLPAEAAALLTDDLLLRLRKEITTTLQDEIERAITKYDARALVTVIHQLVAKVLSRWTHVPATSYDTIDTGRIIAYKHVFRGVVFPSLLKVIAALENKVTEFSDTLQIGRTHGQHAEPITVGFWLATILARILDVAQHLVDRERELVGKFSGPVGAYNCQVAIGFEERSQRMFGITFEELVLRDLRLSAGPISTQILLPEPLARFLFEFTLLSAALGQLARDCRNLQRSEIAEVTEVFEEEQVGSSAMPHKRNPINWEGTEGIATIVKNEFHKVPETLISEHQRDRTGMCIAREFPGIVVLTQHQLDTVNKILPRMFLDRRNLQENFGINQRLITSEAVYVALLMAGYEGDAHELVNHQLVPWVQQNQSDLVDADLVDAMIRLIDDNPSFAAVYDRIPPEVLTLLRSPDCFTGKAKDKALSVAGKAKLFLETWDRKEV